MECIEIMNTPKYFAEKIFTASLLVYLFKEIYRKEKEMQQKTGVRVRNRNLKRVQKVKS